MEPRTEGQKPTPHRALRSREIEVCSVRTFLVQIKLRNLETAKSAPRVEALYLVFAEIGLLLDQVGDGESR